jgi:arabinogalactan oligomer/maltooligosaccharide transport system substrate-binding protein
MDMWRREVLSALGGAAVSTPALSGVAGASDDCPYGTVRGEATGTAYLWHSRSEDDAELLQAAAERWENASESSVALSTIYGSVMARLQSSVLSGDGPHLFEWSHDRAGQFEEAGFLAAQTGEVDIPDCMLTDSALEASFYHGERIGVPWAGETVALYYNTQMVDSPPETIEEMTAIMDAYHNPARGTYGLALPINPYYVSGFAQAYGGKIFDGETATLGLTDDAVLEGLRVVTDDLAPYVSENTDYGRQQSVFLEGDAPLYISGPWELAPLRESSVEFDVTTLPSLPDGGTPRPYTGIKLLYFIKRMEDSESADAAREFAAWFATNEDRLLDHASEGDYVPVHTDLVGSDRLPPEISVFAEQIANGYPTPQNPLMDQVWGALGDALGRTIEGDGDLEANLRQAEQQVYRSWDGRGEGNRLLTVAGRPPRDPDRDGVFEDIDGNGEVDGRDVLTYLRRRNSRVIRRYPARFDFDGDGDSGDLFDALALWDELS